MRPTSSTGKALLISLLFFLANPAFAIEPIPQESGFSGFVNAGAAYLDVKNNMIAGNDLGDVGKDTIGSIFDSPDSESDVIPVLNAEVRYTFASTRTQLFVGNRLEDFLRFDLATLAGVKQELPDESILSAAYLFSGVPTEVWTDPYVEGFPRQKTDQNSRGVRITYDRILGTRLQLQYTFRKIDLDDERSGQTQLVPGGFLTPLETQLLDREGNRHEIEGLYVFEIGEKHTLVPAFDYTRDDLDGGAMSADRYRFQITHSYEGERFIFVTNLEYRYSDFDDRNPIYNKTRDGDRYGGSFTAFYRRLFGVDGLRLTGTFLALKEDSNIDFYESQVVGGILSVFYRF